MKYKVWIAISLVLIINGCSNIPVTVRPTNTIINPTKTSTMTIQTETSTPTSIRINTITPTLTATKTHTITPTRSSSPTVTSTNTPTPSSADHSLKLPLIEYGYLCLCFADYEATLGINIPSLVLYLDGQLLLQKHNQHIVEGKLSEQEMCSVLKKLNDLGFNQVKTNNENDPTNPLYNFGSQFIRAYDASYYAVTVNGENPKKVMVYEPYLEYVVQPMKDVLDYFASYPSSGMKPYRADRLLLWTTPGRMDFDYLGEELDAITWPLKDIRLAADWPKEIYLEGTQARKIFDIFGYAYNYKIFVEEGKEYTVFARPILPHENKYIVRSWTEEPIYYKLSFKCK